MSEKDDGEKNLRFLMLCSVIFLIFLLPRSAIPMVLLLRHRFFSITTSHTLHHSFHIYNITYEHMCLKIKIVRRRLLVEKDKRQLFTLT